VSRESRESRDLEEEAIEGAKFACNGVLLFFCFDPPWEPLAFWLVCVFFFLYFVVEWI
jgi:hypothetical protein